jgi:hypothetical protein
MQKLESTFLAAREDWQLLVPWWSQVLWLNTSTRNTLKSQHNKVELSVHSCFQFLTLQ